MNLRISEFVGLNVEESTKRKEERDEKEKKRETRRRIEKEWGDRSIEPSFILIKRETQTCLVDKINHWET